MSSHNIFFRGEIRKICGHPLLYGAILTAYMSSEGPDQPSSFLSQIKRLQCLISSPGSLLLPILGPSQVRRYLSGVYSEGPNQPTPSCHLS